MRQSVSSGVPLIKLAIFTATRWEHKSVQKSFTLEQTTTVAGVRCAIGHRGHVRVFLFQTGIGPQKAFEVSQAALLNESWGLVVSSGFAGALRPCSIGSIMVGRDIFLEETNFIDDSLGQNPIVCDKNFRERAFRAACSVDHTSQSGNIMTLSRIVWKASEKKNIAARTPAMALDMESGVLGYVARRKNIPFIVVRTISDLVDEDLPIDFNLFLRPHTWPKGVGVVLRRPTSLIQLIRLRRQMKLASLQLTRFFQNFFDGSYLGEAGETQ